MLGAATTSEKNKKMMIRKRKRRLSPLRLAIIDLGTNSVRFDVYRLTGRTALRTYRDKTMIRLGDGVFKTGKLSPDGMLRTIRAFSGYKRLMRELQVDQVVAFGTSALRSSKNAKQFVEQIKAKSGIHVRIISGKEEGALIAKGILSNIVPPKGHFVLVDIGGGSTEVSVCCGQKVLAGQSLKLGANRLQQMFFKTIPPTFKRGALHPVLALRQHLKTELLALRPILEKYDLKLAIGSSGTVRTVARILKKIGRSGQNISRVDLAALTAELQVMSREQIKAIPGLEAKRVDLILSGSILLEEIMFALGVKGLAITDLALRDGILQNELDERFG